MICALVGHGAVIGFGAAKNERRPMLRDYKGR
jgi:TPP-dependent trihydroxycyclohexane-1,2-dione (THcHDO) dehydratase